ncbi:hypothetical protein EPN87_02295 [archaeon]|nr:MAG: hypothetical protein EPN87_02295 [archaeon]
MNKILLALSLLSVVFLSGCVGQSVNVNTTTTTTPPILTTTTPGQTTTTNQTTTTTATNTTNITSMKQFTIHENYYQLSPNTINVNQGDTVRITVVPDSGIHNLFIEGYNIRTPEISTGSSILEFVADKTGTFNMWCEVDAHKDYGMTGQLIVQ